ncbi:uncharacterized protein [Dendrobates tinctorius]|uniref:uncharacterized protein isoform X2 n=1 Tax=Dendrobates tinctorius TaxID=92724 RepID=UPI003CC94420
MCAHLQRVQAPGGDGGHCPVCEDYDLCVNCYNTKNHEHKMVKWGLDDEGNSQGEAQSQSPQESRRLSIQSLVHACKCHNAKCSLPSCQKMKRRVQHTKRCKRKTNGGCTVCKQLIGVCRYHANHCQENKCPVPFCLNVKQKLRQQQIQHRLRQAQLMRRHMATMNPRTVPQQPLPSPTPATPVTPTQHPHTPQTPQPAPQPSPGGMASPGFPNVARTQDYDLCVNCYSTKNHEHKMVKWGLGLDDEGNSQGEAQSKSPQESRRLSIQRCIQSLMHACQCHNANCSLPSCQKMKRQVQHTKVCKRKKNGGCTVCKQLIALCCYHAKHCQENKCPVPFCLDIKQKLRQQQIQPRLQQAQLMRKHMASMSTRTVPQQPLPSPTPATPGTPTQQPSTLQTPQPAPRPSPGGMVSPGFHNRARTQDYDLCVNCYNTKNHEHEMVKWGLDDEGNSQGEAQSQSPQESWRLSIQRCIQSLVHACQCHNANCSLPSCQKMKRQVQHTKGCKRKTNGGCPVCKQLIALCCYHAKHCQENKCPVPFCLNMKQKLRIQHKLQQPLPSPTSATPGTPTQQPSTLQTPQPAPRPSPGGMVSPGFHNRARTQDYDLCVNCYNTKNHEHEMVKWGLDDEGNSQGEAQSQSPQESWRLSIQRCIQSLVHACQCHNANCSLPSCQKMKRQVQHTKGCKRKTNGGCPVCKQLIALCCYHAKHCQENKCPVPFCLNMKQKLRIQHKLQQPLPSPTSATPGTPTQQPSTPQTPQPAPQSSPGGMASPGFPNVARTQPSNVASQGKPSNTLPVVSPSQPTVQPPSSAVAAARQVTLEAQQQ